MMFDKNTLRSMADAVATAMTNTASGDANAWNEATEAERDDMRQVAYAAMGAHDAFLATLGFRVLPPNTVQVPKSDEEAGAMLKSAQTYLDDAKRPPRIVAPPTALLDAQGRKLN